MSRRTNGAVSPTPDELEAAADPLFEANELAPIAVMMRRHVSSPLVLKRAFTALARIFKSGREGSQARVAGIVQATVGAMRAHFTDVEIQYEGMKALTHMIDEKDELAALTDDVNNAATYSQAFLLEHGAVEAVIGAMLAHQEAMYIQINACRLLRWLVFNSSEVRRHAVALGAVEATAASMQTHPTSPGLQIAGCGALANLSRSEQGTAFKETREHGGMEAIVAALRTHRADAELARVACQALVCMVRDDSGLSSREALNHAREAGAIDEVIEVLSLHAANVTAQREASDALTAFVAHDDVSRMHACAVNIMPVLAGVIDVRPHGNAITLGFALIWEDEDACAAARAGGVLEALVTSLLTSIDVRRHQLIALILGDESSIPFTSTPF